MFGGRGKREEEEGKVTPKNE